MERFQNCDPPRGLEVPIRVWVLESEEGLGAREVTLDFNMGQTARVVLEEGECTVEQQNDAHCTATVSGVNQKGGRRHTECETLSGSIGIPRQPDVGYDGIWEGPFDERSTHVSKVTRLHIRLHTLMTSLNRFSIARLRAAGLPDQYCAMTMMKPA